MRIDDLAGRRFSLSESLKKGPVLVSFWGTWCDPCRDEFVYFSELQKKYGTQGLTVVSIAVRDSEKAVRKFVLHAKPSQRVAVDKDRKVFDTWDIRFVPASYLVGRDGRVAAFYDQFDASDLPAIERDIRKALFAYKRQPAPERR